jgi:hypothetical protein
MNDSEWSAFCESVLEVQRSDFMKEMKDRLRTLGSKSSMGIFDSAVLMALARKFAPAICVETGGNLGMSSSFILQGMHEAGIGAGKLLSVEVNPIIPVGSMIPERLKSGFTPMIGDVKQFMKKEVFPDQSLSDKHVCRNILPIILIMQYLFAMRKAACECGPGFIAKTAVLAM